MPAFSHAMRIAGSDGVPSSGASRKASWSMPSEAMPHTAGGGMMLVASRRPPSPTSMMQSRSEEHTSELQSLMRISYAVFCLKKKNKQENNTDYNRNTKKES